MYDTLPAFLHRGRIKDSLCRARLPALLFTAAMSLAIVASIAGCDKERPPASQPMEVSVTKVVEQTIPTYHDYVGTTEAIRSVEIRARVEGFLTSREFVEGTDVERNALLYTIEQEPYAKALAERAAELAARKAEAEDASLEATRFKNLLEKASTSQSDYDRHRARSDSATAQVELASAAKDRAAIELSYCTVKAPFAGRVGRTQVHVGNLVGAGDATVLTSLVQLDPLYVLFNVPAKHIPTMVDLLAKGRLRVGVSVQDDADSSYPGSVDFIDNSVDPDTSTVLVRAVVKNSSETLLPGQYANVRLFLEPIENAILVPANTIVQQQGGQSVYVIDKDNRVVSRTVELGENYHQMRLVTKGLEAGERIAVDKLQQLRPGAEVIPQMKAASRVETSPPETATPAEPAKAPAESEGGGKSG